MTRRSRRESQEHTRDRLRTAAAREFALRGVSAASIDTIAETAGFSRGAFYSNYNSKHDLLLELLQREQERELQAWRQMIEHATTLDAALPALAERFDAYLITAREQGLLATELRLEAERHAKFGEAYFASSNHIFALSLELVRVLVRKAGGDEAEVLPIALALHAVAFGLVLDWRLEPHGSQSGGAVMALFLRRMLVGRSRHDGPTDT